MKRFLKTMCAAMCSTLCLVSFQATAETVKIGESNGLNVGVASSDDSTIVIEYNLGAFDQKTVVIDGDDYQQLTLKKEAWLVEKGAPELPKITRSIAIPDDATMEVTVIEEDYVELDMKVTPSKGIVMRTVNIGEVPYSFSDVYDTDAFYPAQRVKLGSPYQLRNMRGVVVDVYPFAYNPVTETLRVYTKLVIGVANVGAGSFNQLSTRAPQKSDIYFEEIYRNNFINYTPASRQSAVGESGRMIVICHDAFCNAVQPFVDWKNQIGIATTKVAVSTIGNTSSAIKSFIQTEYNKNDGLAFIQLVGDASHVQPFYAGSEAQDPAYSLLAGNDDYPDILVGRFSAESVADVETQVERTIYYERDMPNAAWLNKGTGIASSEGPGDNNEYDWQHMRNIRTDLLGYTFTAVDEFYDGSQGGADAAGNPSNQMVANALNDGRSFLNYVGHGGTTSFATSGFNNADVNNLQNINKLPFVVAVACVVGKFDTTTSFSEAWLRATHNNQPTGAVGFYGASINQSWRPPMAAQDEITDLLVAKTYKTVGGLMFNGSIAMMNKYGADGIHMFKTWHIFGDASLQFTKDSGPPTDPPTIPAGVTASGESMSMIKVSWNAAAHAATYELYQASSATGTYTQIASGITGTNRLVTGLTADTTYFFKVKAVNSLGTSGFSSYAQGKTLATNPYCTSASTTFFYGWVKEVEFAGVANSSEGNFYSDFTSVIIPVTRNQSYELSLTQSFIELSLTPGFGNRLIGLDKYWKVWIDYNRDGVFASNEMVLSSSGPSITVSGTVTIPTSAVAGDTVMRVIMSEDSIYGPCGSHTYGETEDYTVRVD